MSALQSNAIYVFMSLIFVILVQTMLRLVIGNHNPSQFYLAFYYFFSTFYTLVRYQMNDGNSHLLFNFHVHQNVNLSISKVNFKVNNVCTNICT